MITRFLGSATAAALVLCSSMALAQLEDPAQAHSVDQLVGSWVYQTCTDQGDCDAVERTYEPAEAEGLYYYTESVGGEERDGFVSYDEGAEAFVEYDYPESWSRDEFEQGFYSEQTDSELHGDYDLASNQSTLQWQMNEDGNAMTLRAGAESITETPSEFLGVVFSRVPIIGSDPIIGGDND